MSEYMIKEDHKRLILYTLFNFILTTLLVILAAGFYSYGAFLLAFLAITGLWFSIKAMHKYASKWVKKTPVCEFKHDEVVIYSLPGDPKIMKYREITEVKIIRDKKSMKLFFAGDNVEHPSGWYYAGAMYPFQRSLLDEVENNSIKCLEKHNVITQKVSK